MLLTEPPITDSAGNVWQLIAGGRILLNGVPDVDPQLAVQLLYVNNKVWRQTLDLRWSCVVQPGRPWQPPGGYGVSPVSETPEAQMALNEIINAINAMQAGFDTLMAAVVSPVNTDPIAVGLARLQSGLSAIQTSLDTLTVNTAANQATLANLLQTILSRLSTPPAGPAALHADLVRAVHALQPAPPSALHADLARATRERQAIPPAVTDERS